MCVCQVKTQLYQPPELPCLGPLQVHVSGIGEDGLIYVRTQDAGNYSYTSLTDSINSFLIKEQMGLTLMSQKSYIVFLHPPITLKDCVCGFRVSAGAASGKNSAENEDIAPTKALHLEVSPGLRCHWA